MITGAQFWSDRKRYYLQTNNSIEALLKKTGRRWLESCGPTTAVMCMDMVGHLVECSTSGGWKPQPEDVLSLLMNDPRSADEMRAIRTGVENLPGNRVPQYYPWAVRKVFGAKAEFRLPLSWDALVAAVRAGGAVQVCRVDPGHYQAAVAYDDATSEIIYHDPWPDGQPGANGWSLRLGVDRWKAEYHGWGVVYTG